MLKNDLLIKTLNGEPCHRPPVWIMRQAGRILPEYRELRAKAGSFKTLVTTPELASEVTLQPIRRFGVDAAILFSDILVIPEAMGMDYSMVEKFGPKMNWTIENSSDLLKLKDPDVEKSLAYVFDAIDLSLEKLNNEIPLIGFSGAPWTIFCYMIEGQGSKTFSKARRFLFQYPALSHALLDKITAITITYLKGQIKHGVSLVQLFDSWAGLLGPREYQEFGIYYMQKILDGIGDFPVTIFAKGAHSSLHSLSKTNARVLGIDWVSSPEDAIEATGGLKILQGNLDPCVLYDTEANIAKKTNEMLSKFQFGKHIVNLGHGVYPDTPYQNVQFFVDTVKKFKYNGVKV